MSNPNWAKLVSEGRAKEIGIPWGGDTDTEGTEAYARYVLKIPAEYVRTGVLTLDAYQEARQSDASGTKPLERKTRKELMADAEDLGVVVNAVTPDSVVREVIRGKKAKNK